MDKHMTRRDFLEVSAGAVTLLGFSLVRLPGRSGRLLAAAPKTIAEVPVIWMATGACSGCSVSLLNSASPTIQELLLDEVLPGSHLSLRFHATVMAAAGELAMETLNHTVETNKGKFVLVVDGVTATAEDGLYCSIGERPDGSPITGYEHVRDLSRQAMAVLAVGSCAAFGGIPAAGPNPTAAISVPELLQREGIKTPVVRIPGCPPHPDWIVGTIAALLLGGVPALRLDPLGRPGAFFSELIHDNCPYRGHFERGDFAERFGQHGCLIKLGCKGPITQADCPIRKFNNGTSWCCQAGHPCIGCCHPDFPFEGSMFQKVRPESLSFPEAYPPAQVDLALRKKADKDTYVAVGMIGVAGFLAGAGVAAAARRLNGQQAEEHTEPAAADSGGKGVSQ